MYEAETDNKCLNQGMEKGKIFILHYVTLSLEISIFEPENKNLYKTLLKPVLTYGRECCSLSRRNEEQLHVFERRILRKIFGPICDYGKWRIRYNSELYSIYTDPDII